MQFPTATRLKMVDFLRQLLSNFTGLLIFERRVF